MIFPIAFVDFSKNTFSSFIKLFLKAETLTEKSCTFVEFLIIFMPAKVTDGYNIQRIVKLK